MLEKYPEYRLQKITIEDLYKKFPSLERKTIDDFLEYCKISAGELKLKDIRANIVQFRDIAEKDFETIELKDIHHYLKLLKDSGRKAWTVQGMKIHVKRFLRWKFKDWSLRFNNFEDFKLLKTKHDKIEPEALFTEQEAESLIRAADSLRDKAMLCLFIESGCRPQELRDLKWENVKFQDEDLTEIKFHSTKTGESRKFYCKASTVHLKRWMQEYCFPNRTQKDFVFPAPRNREHNLSRNMVNSWFARLGKKAGITKKIYPYLARHSKATQLYNNPQTNPTAHKALGHSQMMSKTYQHTSDDEVKEALLKLYNIKEISPEKKHQLELDIDNLKEFVSILMEEKINGKQDLSRTVKLYNKLSPENKAEIIRP